MSTKNAEYWIKRVNVIHHEVYNPIDGNMTEEYYCPFCKETATVAWNLFHEEDCPLADASNLNGYNLGK